jgi:hypothetical protein
MTNLQKFWKALFILKNDVECTVTGDVTSQSDFNNNIAWNTGTDENDRAITTKTNPHSEITWAAVKAEMDKL